MNTAATVVAAPRVRLYVVDPRKFRKLSTDSSNLVSSASVESLRFLLPKAVADEASTNVTKVSVASTSLDRNSHGHVQVDEEKSTKSNTKKKKPRKRKVEKESPRGETENDKKFKTFLSTESTTRVGRISKNPPRLCSSQSEVTSAATSSAEPPPKIRIREPPEVFRCQACQKVYLGHTKLSLHYKAFPEHQIKSMSTIAAPPVTTPNLTLTTIGTETNGHFASVRSKAPRSLVSVGIQVSLPSDTVRLQRSNEGSPSLSMPMTPPGYTNRKGLESGLNMARTISGPELTPPSLSNMLLADSPYSVSQSSLEPISVPDLCLPISLSPSSKEIGLNTTSNGFCESAFSRFRVSSQNSYLHNSHGPNIFQSHHQNLPVTVAVPMYQFNPPCTPPGDNCHNSSDKNPATPVLKAIWEFVEDRMIQQGINQILAEISDVAERLGKIARDKFIPIREEEERLYCSSPIIQVDSPFLSHLLDLPFGTYVFREDAGVRIKPPPPPSAAELSLTGEVDVDKFLSPDILSLPHLTNIDFAAIL